MSQESACVCLFCFANNGRDDQLEAFVDFLLATVYEMKQQ